MKEKEFDNLIISMSQCRKCMSLKKKNGKDCSLVNIYRDECFSKNIPSIWTDWYHRFDSKIMVVGQDWGPFVDMEKLYNSYLATPTLENWKNLIDTEKSLTKKMLTKFLVESAEVCHAYVNIDNIFITNAIMCARKGDNYRGDNIDLLKSTIYCSSFLKRQIDIVKPRVIVALGYYPLLSLSTIYGFKIDSRLGDVICNTPVIKMNDVVIVPCYHPTAQIKKEIQLKQYIYIWENL